MSRCGVANRASRDHRRIYAPEICGVDQVCRPGSSFVRRGNRRTARLHRLSPRTKQKISGAVCPFREMGRSRELAGRTPRRSSRLRRPARRGRGLSGECGDASERKSHSLVHVILGKSGCQSLVPVIRRETAGGHAGINPARPLWEGRGQ